MIRSLALVLLFTSIASAQPASDASKGDAKALMASGLKLYAAKDYLGALAVFKDAYARFPSPKILLNIGTALRALDRNAEAANAYQGYIDAPDIDAAKKAEAAKVLAELDAKLSVLEISVTPADAEVQVNNDEWMPAKAVAHYRVQPGPNTLRVRAEGFGPLEQSIDTKVGPTAFAFSLRKVETTTVTTTTPTVTTTATTTNDGLVDRVEPAQPPGKLGVFAYEHVDVQFKGAATFVGAAYEVAPRLQAEVAGVLGPSFGAYAGARYAFMPGKLRPLLALGVPVFFSDGARFAVRGAAGIEVALHRNFGVVAEVGVEHVFNPEANFAATTFIPALGAIARL